jgi:hypothetical protein
MTVIVDPLGTTAESWQARLEKLRRGHFFGRFFAATRQRLRDVADRLGMRLVPNLAGRPAVIVGLRRKSASRRKSVSADMPPYWRHPNP